MTTELDNYQEWQASRYGDILPEPIVTPGGDIWGTEAEIQRKAEWCQLQHELQLRDYDKD